MRRLLCIRMARFLGILLFLPALRAQADIRIAVPEIATLLEADGNGVYQRIFSKAMESLDYVVQQDFYPYKRALVQFKAGRADCIFSFTTVLTREFGEDRIIASYPLGSFGYFLFTREGDAPVTSHETLTSLRLGAVIGHDNYYGNTLEYPGEILQVQSEEQALALLWEGRIDVAIAALPDVQPYLDRLSYSADFPMFLGYDRLTCYNTPETREFLEDLSRELKSLKANGTYRELAGDHYLDFDF